MSGVSALWEQKKGGIVGVQCFTERHRRGLGLKLDADIHASKPLNGQTELFITHKGKINDVDN